MDDLLLTEIPEYRMNRQMAEFLVNTFLEQFEQMPFHRHAKRMPIRSEQKEKLISIVEKTPAWNHPKKMQFEVPGNEQESSIYYPDRLATHILYPRRVFTNYNRPVDKSLVERKVGSFLQWVYDKGKSTFDSEVICREMRDELKISAIRRASLDAGNFCSLMIHYYITLPNAGKHGGDSPVHVPLFIIPGATKTDLETLSVYSLWHQHQRPEIMTYLRHGVFNSNIEDRYFECLERFNARARLIKKELERLRAENNEKNELRISELENYKIPFLGT